MKILPELSKVKTLASEGKYDIIPISTEILSDIRTPIETMKILKTVSTHCYMLESVAESERWGRYTFLGFDPKISVTVNDGKMKIGDVSIETDYPNKYLRQIQEPQILIPSSVHRRTRRLFLLRLSLLQ